MLTNLLNKSVNTKAMKENNKNTEAAILEAADKLFKEKGFKGATTTMIAGQAGVPPCHAALLFPYQGADIHKSSGRVYHENAR